ncbi:photosystem II cytochrome PsbV2 [Gloeocapsopsis sp. IPPAS B-1203]|uniref:photosystem II cytochrome PsbV2 n=1 Tax=Gloeocapsopsis sp. IPPAS B-1203 TaxID=2049454 RepID=UPI000C193AE5|nr:photosystem II cytochrome PsbV2 [Gloeocapsopsis sp. IPPAS B-1203]PIG91361.1 photosystem II cytochrome PsbV2 [Gloeocapsopsis sp. IPPAS B-1203]
MLSTSCVRRLVILLSIVVVSLLQMTPSATAAGIDPYLARYLRLTEPIALEVDEQGATREFSLEEISQGKVLFENNCLNCHVGGATLPDPQTSLALDKLKGANPPRDNVGNLVAFLRQPMVYDGSEETYWCRQVPESWMTQEEVESLAAFVLTAAQKARGWGTESF